MIFFYSTDLFADWRFLGLMIAIAAIFILTLVFASIGYSRKVKYRASLPPICSWEYSANEWREYARVYDLGKRPKGAAKVKITPLDLWIADDAHNVRMELTATTKCVTDCRIIRNILAIRVLWVRNYGKGIKKGANNFRLPIPIGKEPEALSVVKYFSKDTPELTEKLALITRYNTLGELFEDDML